MAAGFKIRKLSSPTPIGTRLCRARERQGLTLEQVEELTTIRAKFIEALESDRWDSIPSEVYGRGYLERYAKALGLPVVTIMNQYDNERSKYASRCQESSVEFTPKAYIIPRAILTPRLIGSIAAMVVVFGFATVAGAQLMKFSQVPFLQVSTSEGQSQGAEHMVVASGNHVVITGKTLPEATIVINGTPAPVIAGGFSQGISLHKGVNPIVVQATDSRGKTSSETLAVVMR